MKRVFILENTEKNRLRESGSGFIKSLKNNVTGIKKELYFLFIALIFIIFSVSCAKETSREVTKGSIKFSIGMTSDLKSFATSDTIGDTDTIGNYFALVSIVNLNGTTMDSTRQITFYKFGDQFISESISLEIGNYRLTQFIFFKNAAALYVTPMEGSERAQLVTNPLPIDFTVNENNNTLVSPEVLTVGNNPPQLFGYSSFNFSVIQTFFFKIVAFGSDSSHWDTIPETVTAHLEVVLQCDSAFAGTKVLDYDLGPQNNDIEVIESAQYQLKVYKPGYHVWYNSYSNADLKQYKNNTLKVYLHRLSNDTIF